MPPQYAYQRVDNDTEGEEHGETPLHVPASAQPWYRRPSVLWLLPTFVLFNLAMGATAMPRTNILISLICRTNLLNDESTFPRDASNIQPRHGGSMGSQHDNPMNGTAANTTASFIIIGEYNPQCATNDVESAAAMLNLWGNLIAGILGAICTPFWGKLSDRFGRIRPLAATSTVMFVSEIFMVMIAKFPDALPLPWVYFTFVLEGLSGSFILVMALASAYAADVTQMADRNVALGLFHGSMFFGMAAGPVAGGFIGMSSGKSNPFLIFYTALGMRFIAILWLGIVPESHEDSTPDPRPLRTQLRSYLHSSSRGTWVDRVKRMNPVKLLRILTPANTHISRRTQRNLLVLSWVNMILFGAVMGGMMVMMLYSEFRFGWDNKDSGIFLSTVNIFRTLATMVVLPLTIKISRRYFGASTTYTSGHGGHDHGHGHGGGEHAPDGAMPTETGVIEPLDLFLLRASIVSDTIGYAGYALAPTGFFFTLSGAVASLGAIGLATSEAAMTKLLPSSQTGELLGALGFLQAMARIVAPTVASLVYSMTTNSFPQLVFWGIAAMFAVGGLATIVVKVGDGKGEKEGEDAIPLREGVSKGFDED